MKPDRTVGACLDERLRRASRKVCLYLFLGALAVRLLYLSQYAASPFFWVPALDSLYHDLLARAIAAGHAEREAFFRAPLYYYMLGAIYGLFGHSLWAARIAQAVLGAGSCVLLHAIGGRVFRPSVGLFAGGAMALYGPLVFFDGELLTPVLEVFLDLLCLLLVIRGSQDGSRRQLLAAGLVLGLSAITRPNVLVAAPLLLVWIWRQERCGTTSAARHAAALFLAGVVAAPALVTLRNYRVAGDPVFIASQGGVNLFLGNRPEADGFTPSTPTRYRFEGPYEDSVALYGRRAAEEARGRPLRASEAQSYWVGRVLQWWREDPRGALQLTWKKWVLAWTHREIRNNHAYDFVRAEFAPCLWFCPLGFWFAGTFGLLGIGLAWRRSSMARLLALFVFLYIASFVLFFVADRYRLPVVPLLLLFGSHALLWGWQKLRAREERRLLPAGAALALLALFVNVDWYRTATPATRALDHWSAGNRYKEMGRLPEALTQYRRALSLDPANADVWTNLGAVHFYAGRLTEAVGSFRRSLRLVPGDSGVYYNLALCELRLGRPGRARRLLERAVQLDPAHARARAELARLRKPD
jgi:tetratricopeptide (TPR) repeat protein